MAVFLGTGNNDTLTGTEQNDIIFGQAGNDTISSFGGDDSLFGEAGDDTIDGGNGNNFIDGGNGNDSIDVGNGNNLILGGNGNDNIFGYYGNDILNGGAGNDRLEGSFISSGLEEIDRLTGGDGSDTFVLAGSGGAAYESSYIRGGNSNYALITDFNLSEDKIELARVSGTNRLSQDIEYSLGAAPSGLPQGTAIYVDNLGTKPDLIAILQGVEPNSVSLSQPYFQFDF